MSQDEIIEAYKKNIAASKTVKEVLAIAADFVKLNRVDPDRFFDHLAREAAARIGKRIVDDGPTFMTEEEAVAFEYKEVPFKSMKGKRVGSVDTERLAYYIESDFMKSLRRYVGCLRFIRRQNRGR